MRSAPLSAIVLAAGDGRRMRSTRPKPLHVLCGKTMLHYVLDSLSECKLERVVVVVGSTGDQVEKKLRDQSVLPRPPTMYVCLPDTGDPLGPKK